MEGEDECLIVAIVVITGTIAAKQVGRCWFVSRRFNDAVVNVVVLIKDGWSFVHWFRSNVVAEVAR